MNPPDADAVTQAVVNEYPFPLAFAFKEAVLEAPDDQGRVRGIIHTFTLGIQYAALICASEYAQADYRDATLTWSLQSMKRPLISHLSNFVSAAVVSFKKHGVTPLVTELESFSAQMRQTKVEVPMMVDNVPREVTQQLGKALMELRNTIAHKDFHPNWPQLAERYLPHLIEFLRAMKWCADYPLLREVGGGQMVRLRGVAPQFTSAPIPEAAREELARAQREQEYLGLLLASGDASRFLNLYPLILMEACEECQTEPLHGMTEEVFLFNGDEGRYLAYLGVRHARYTEHHQDAVEDLYQSKKIHPPVSKANQIEPPELSQRARWQTQVLLDAYIAEKRYLPQVYHRRPEIDADISAFMREANPRVGFCLLGEAGIGKTSLLCRKVEEWSGRLGGDEDGEATAGDAVLFYQGKGLFAQGDLETRIMHDLYLEGSFQELLTRLRGKRRRLVVVVDAVNEDKNAANNLQALCQFIIRYANTSALSNANVPLKVIFSFRSAYYGKTLRELGYAGDGDEQRDLFLPHAFFTQEVEQQGQKRQTYRFTLDRMRVLEAEVVYEGYRSFVGVVDEETKQVRRFRPLTSFSSLSPSTRQLLAHPWYLRMTLEAYDGRQVPATLWVGDLLKEFCRARIYGVTEGQQRLFEDRANFIDELVHLMRQQQTDSVERGDPLLSQDLTAALRERQVALSPYLQLVDEGVLREREVAENIGDRTYRRYFIEFTFERLFEHLLSQDFLREVGGWEKLSGEHLAVLLTEGKNFKHLTGAAEFLLTEATQQGKFALLVETLNSAEKWTASPVFVRMMMLLIEMKHQNLEPLVEFIIEHGEAEKSFSLFTNTSASLWSKYLYAQMLLFTGAAERVGRDLVAKGYKDHIETMAAGNMNKGVALRRLGQVPEAIVCFNETIKLLSENSDESTPNLLHYLALATVNKGLALGDQGYFDESLSWFDYAIDIFRLLTDHDGQSDLSRNLAAALKNKGDGLVRTGQHSEAIVYFNEAITILEQLVNSDDRTELLTVLANAVGGSGLVLKRLGRYNEAVVNHDGAIAIYKRLIEEDGRNELAKDIAGELMNKGNLYREMKQPLESLKCYEDASSFLDRLVDEEKLTPEIFILMSRVMMNRGVTLLMLGLLEEALTVISGSIEIQEKLVEAGMTHLTPRLLQGLGIRLDLYRKSGNWKGVAVDVTSVLNYVLPFMRMKSPPEFVKQEFKNILNNQLRDLSDEERIHLYEELGEFAGVVRKMIEAVQ